MKENAKPADDQLNMDGFTANKEKMIKLIQAFDLDTKKIVIAKIENESIEKFRARGADNQARPIG